PARQQHRRSNFIRAESMVRDAMVKETTVGQSSILVIGKSGRTRCLENNFSQSIAPSFSNEPTQLFVRADAHSLRSIHAVDDNWSSARPFLVHLYGHIRTAWSQSRSGQNASAHCGILDVGRRVHRNDTLVCPSDADGVDCNP